MVGRPMPWRSFALATLLVDKAAEGDETRYTCRRADR
jgi:hypothetical protein